MSRRLLCEVTLSVLALVAVSNSNLALMVTKVFVDAFAIGHGGSKVKLLLSVYLLVTLASLVKLPWRKSWGAKLVAGLVLLHLLSLGSYLVYCWQNGLTLIPQNVCFFDGVHSSTRLQHIHTSKLVMATLLGYAGQGLDAGRPFVHFFPTWWRWLHSATFLIIGFLALLSLCHTRSKRSFGEYLCYFMVLMTLLKNSLDGGPLDTQTMAALPFFAWLLGYRVTWGAGLAGLLLTVSLLLSGPTLLAFDLWRFSLAVVSFSVPLALQTAWLNKSWAKTLMSAALIGLCLLAPFAQFQGWVRSHRLANTPSMFRYGESGLKKDWVIQVVSVGELPNTETSPVQVVSHGRGRRLCLSNVKITKDTSVLSLCDEFGLNIFRKPISWTHLPAYVTIEGPSPLPSEAAWANSELVSAFCLDETGPLKRLILQLKVGGGINIANEAFGTTPYAAQNFRISYENPRPNGDWQQVKP